jgi:type II secretory pathway component GspD/PulD (secretin)
MEATMPRRQNNRYQPKQACLIAQNALGDRQPHGVRNKVATRWMWYLPLLWIALGVGYLAGPALASEEVVQIRIVHRDANDMLTMVQPLISQYGFISADTASNSLIVIDQAANVRRIQQLVSQIDQPVPQLKIRVQYGRQETNSDQSVATRGKIEVGDATVAVGNKKKKASMSSCRRMKASATTRANTRLSCDPAARLTSVPAMTCLTRNAGSACRTNMVISSVR